MNLVDAVNYIWACQMAAVLDMYYGDRWSWCEPDVCLQLAVCAAGPWNPEWAMERKRHLERRRRFDQLIKEWVSDVELQLVRGC